MMENRYDRYKDSGIAWIGEIPEHWIVKRLKFSCNIWGRIGFRGYKSDDLVSEGEGAITLSPSNMKDMKMDYTNRTYLSWKKYYESPEIMVSNNDILMVKTGSSYGKCSFVENMPMECTINPQIVVFKQHRDYPKFLAYNFQTEATRAFVETSVVGGTIPTISQEKIMNYFFAFPPFSEQQSIAAYLDQKCGEIDELITLQEEMITKLQSYKQSVITEAVTKGLNKNVPLKDSGIEWIGEIPEHWEVRRMKSIYNFGKGLSITKADLVDKGIPVISYGQIHSKLNIGTCIKDSLIRYVPKVFLENNNTSLVKKGDVIFADTSEDLEGCGNCIYIDRDMLLYAGYHTIIAKSISTSYNRYFSYLFQTDCWRFQIRRMVNGVKLFSIPQKLLASADLIVPSTQEQQSIADYLDQRCSEIDELISIKQQKIEKLKEYKKSLIFECVTGKRKVG